METNRNGLRMNRRSILMTSAMTTLLCLSVAAPGFAQTAPAAAPAPEADNTVVVVTGIRRSIQDAITVKRNSTVIMDSISAEDIGKLPDQNISETLSRVPGVQISRIEGQGSSVSVRGISLNKLQLNGNSFVGSAANGDPALRDVSPELLAGVDVIKAPSADLQEGWLGAVINLRTKRPLDFKKPIFSARVEGSYADQADDFGYKGSMFYSRKFLDGKFGVLFGASYSKSSGRSDQYTSGGWTYSNAVVDVTGDGVKDQFFMPLRFQEFVDEYEDTRSAGNLTLQWRPIEELTLTVDGLTSKRDVTRTNTAQQAVLTNAITNGTILADGTLSGGTFSNVTLRPLIYGQDGDSKTNAISFNGEYKKGHWLAHVNASHSEGSGTGNDGEALSSNGNVNVLVARQVAPNAVTASYTLGNSVSPNYSINTNFDRMDPSQYEIYAAVDAIYPVSNSGNDADFDVQYTFDGGFLKSVKAGARTETIKVFSETENAVYPAFSLYDPTPANSLRANEVPGLNYGGQFTDFMNGESGAFPRTILTGSVDPVAFRQFLHATGPNFDPITSKQSMSQVEQKTDATFIRADFQSTLLGVDYSGNIGVRQIKSQRTSTGYAINGSTATLQSVTREFQDTLPSFNLIAKPATDWRIRFAAAKVLARPPLSQTGVGIQLFPVTNTGSAGNPDLKPFTATQYDLSAEWYFAPASMLSLAVFKKDVSAFTRTIQVSEDHPEAPNNTTFQTVYLINRPVNGEQGKVNGFEINYQQALNFLPAPFDGLGYTLNYTLSDSDTPNVDELTGKRLPLPYSSKNSYNAVFYYEKGPFSGRIAYNYRSEFLMIQQGKASGGSLYAAPRGQVDASASYQLSSNYRLTFEAVNLSKSVNTYYVGNPNRVNNSFLDDRRIYFGLTGTF